MRSRSGPAALLGILAISGVAYVVAAPFLLKAQDSGLTPGQMLATIAIGAGILALVAYFMIYAARSVRVPLAKKVFWRRALLVGNVFAAPVFWYLYVWRDVPTSTGSEAASQGPEARLAAMLEDYQAKRRQ